MDARPEFLDPLRLLLTPKQAAQALAISLRTLRYRTAEGAIPYVAVGRLVRYCPDDLRRWVETNKKRGRVADEAAAILGNLDKVLPK